MTCSITQGWSFLLSDDESSVHEHVCFGAVPK